MRFTVSPPLKARAIFRLHMLEGVKLMFQDAHLVLLEALVGGSVAGVEIEIICGPSRSMTTVCRRGTPSTWRTYHARSSDLLAWAIAIVE